MSDGLIVLPVAPGGMVKRYGLEILFQWWPKAKGQSASKMRSWAICSVAEAIRFGMTQERFLADPLVKRLGARVDIDPLAIWAAADLQVHPVKQKEPDDGDTDFDEPEVVQVALPIPTDDDDPFAEP